MSEPAHWIDIMTNEWIVTYSLKITNLNGPPWRLDFQTIPWFPIPWVLPAFWMMSSVARGGSQDIRWWSPQLLTGHLWTCVLGWVSTQAVYQKRSKCWTKVFVPRNSRLHHGLLSYLLLIARINKCIWGLETSGNTNRALRWYSHSWCSTSPQRVSVSIVLLISIKGHMSPLLPGGCTLSGFYLWTRPSLLSLD